MSVLCTSAFCLSIRLKAKQLRFYTDGLTGNSIILIFSTPNATVKSQQGSYTKREHETDCMKNMRFSTNISHQEQKRKENDTRHGYGINA